MENQNLPESEVNAENQIMNNEDAESLKEKLHSLLSDSDAEDNTQKSENGYDDEEFEDYDDDLEYDMRLILDGIEKINQNPVKNKTFTSEKLREIDRRNAILMDKILANNKRRNQYKIPPKYNGTGVTSAAVNRKKYQEKVNYENQILLKKIQSVKPHVLHPKK